MRKIIFLLIFFCTISMLVEPAEKPGTNVFLDIINSFPARNIGPAVMGGRTVDFAVVENNPSIIYAAVGPSGLWKSIDNGINWSPVFERQSSVSAGAVAVSASHPDIVWLGTGEPTSRNSVAIGDGVYKSNDAGKTWQHMGLTETRHIDRILVAPNNPDIVYIGAMGHLWGPNSERGVFKTIDGGLTWEKVLYFDEDTGIAEMVMDPSNSRIIYAAAYNHRRLPYHFTSGGPHSGIYRTNDGGKTWKKLTKGLPEGVNGRCGLSICLSQPHIVYAIIENKNGGIFRSQDKGENWVRMSDKKTYDKVNFRPFYYSKITVDPNNPQVIYAYSGRAFISEDGGKTFSEIGTDLHADHHRIWVDPNNSNHIIDGNDGGIDISWDRGKNWYSVQNAIWAESYQVAFDMREPYYVYTGLQDNGNWAGPSNSRQKKGILNCYWTPVGGGDGFYTQVDPRDHNILFRNLQMGNIERFNQAHGQNISVIPRAGLDKEPFRFNWNSPIHLSPHNPDILYFGGNFLFKSTDRGDSWEKISPDLSTNDPKKLVDSGGPITIDNTGAEVHCTIFTIAESPLKAGIIWAGTDDGNLWVTRDHGGNWNNVVKNIKGLPPNSWVSRVEPSHFAEGTIYVTFDRHRSDDYAPYIYKSENFGATWISLRNNLPKTGYLHVIREDPQNPDLLYLGSEFSLFFSLDKGKHWFQYKKDFPTIAVRDIAVHPRDKDLIIGTHGRGVWIFDDIGPLQQMAPSIIEKDVHLFNIRPALIYFERKDVEYYAKPVFSAPNPPYGTAITYYLKKEAPEDRPVRIHIYDAENKYIRTLKGTGSRGINRIYWDLRDRPPFKVLPDIFKGDLARWYGTPKGPFVLPGTYKIALEFGDQKLETTVMLKKDKNLEFPLEEWKKNRETMLLLGDLLEKGFSVGSGLITLNREMERLAKSIKDMKEPPQAVMDKLNGARQILKELAGVFSSGGADSGIYRRPLKISLQGGRLSEQIFALHNSIGNYPGKPTITQEKTIREIVSKVKAAFKKGQKLFNVELPALNGLLREYKIDHLKIPPFPSELF